MSAERTARVVRGRRARGLTTVVVPPIPLAARTVDEISTDAAPAVAVEAQLSARLEAAARGYQDGYAIGRDEALADVRAGVGVLLVRLDSALQTIEAAEQRSFDAVTDQVLDFALEVAAAIVGRELELATAPARDALQRALRLVPERAQATVRVNPVDFDALGDVSELAGGRDVDVVVDAGIEPGGCIVHAGDCDVDAQIGPALDRVREVLGR